MKTLYLTDLDGTLLRSDQQLSDYTTRTINNLTQSGVHFSYATARSQVSASRVTGGLATPLPVICYNGGFIFDGKTKEILQAHYFTQTEMEYLVPLLAQHGVSPIAYAFINSNEHFSFIEENADDGMKFFLNSRVGDPRRRPVQNTDELYHGNVFYLTCISNVAQLSLLHEVITADKRFYTVYHKDIYSDARWCEIMPAQATKAAAALQLKSMLGCEKLVVFGDGINDIPLFTVADESYAMANAEPELKEIATAVIDSNDNDGVAKWMDNNVH